MPIYMAEELPDLPDYSAINRAVPQMPSGMEKEEECVSWNIQPLVPACFSVRHLTHDAQFHKQPADGDSPIIIHLRKLQIFPF